jgi:hypothetical protein
VTDLERLLVEHVELGKPNLRHPYGWWVRLYLWFHVALGWILAALLLAAVTGFIKRE